MNVIGRQVSRSSSRATNQRQYSENFQEASLSRNWLQSASLPSPQDLGLRGQGSRMYQNSRSSSQRNAGDELVAPSELSPGLLDLHSVDTELLPEMLVPGLYDGYSLHQPDYGASFEDSDQYLFANKLANKPPRSVSENNLRSFSADKERANNVAKIKVVVRKRPLNKKEIAKKEEDIITVQPNSNALAVHETKLKVDLTEYMEKHEFVFDAVLNEGVSNDEVYFETVEPIVPLIFNRTKATCFAYGQTGSGKTYTMQPLPLKASQHILRMMHHTYRSQGFQLFVSFFEIYGGKLFDLLNDRKKLCMREDGKQQVCIVGLQEYRVSDVETIKNFIEKGNATRSTGTTGANEESSRSHAILQLAIKRSVDGSELKPPRPVGKLSFIDLAGSERGADTTDNDKQTRIEGAEINKSLLALKECIRALDNDQGHIPFRGSKLTEVLRDSFVGDSRTVMISCISPSSGSCEHTLNTLRYADRVKSLSKANASKKDTMSYSSLRSSSAAPTEPNFNDSSSDATNEKNRFGWSKQNPIARGREEGYMYASVGSSYDKQNDFSRGHFDYSENTYEQDKQISGLGDKRKAESQMNQKSNLHSNDDLNALLKEEEDLVNAHRRQVEETIDIVKEEMSLVAEAEQPGNQVGDYICRLNDILSQKAAGIVRVQTLLARFQKRLNDHSVLISSAAAATATSI